jgi:hypothetical protein
VEKEIKEIRTEREVCKYINHRVRCREKKKQKGEKKEKELKEIRTEREVCKYINRERKKKESVSEQD